MRAFLPLLLIAALALPADASHCATWSTTPPAVWGYDTSATEAAGYYVIEDCLDGCGVDVFFSLWVYEESNGIPGLQREDEVVDDTCHGIIDGDRIIL